MDIDWFLKIFEEIPKNYLSRFKDFLSFLLQSNLFIALAAVFLAIETQIQLGLKPEWHPYLFMIFFATVFEYNLHRFITIVFYPSRLSEEKYQWVNRHLTLFYGLFFCSILGFLVALVVAKREVLLVLLPFGFITLFYTIPIFYTDRKFIRLRDVPYMKIFSIAFVWAAATIFLPVAKSAIYLGTGHLLCVFIERFLFVFAITLPFDIRDMKEDLASGIKTIPLLIGEKKSLVLANVCLVVFSVLGGLHYSIVGMDFMIWAYIMSGITTIIAINSRAIQNSPIYHYGILDGTMLLQGILVLVAYAFDNGILGEIL